MRLRPTATARALEPRIVRSDRWRPMPADTMAMSRSTASLSAASRPFHAACPAAMPIAERAHDREADVAEEEAGQRLDDARAEALLAAPTFLSIGRACASAARARA